MSWNSRYGIVPWNFTVAIKYAAFLVWFRILEAISSYKSRCKNVIGLCCLYFLKKSFCLYSVHVLEKVSSCCIRKVILHEYCFCRVCFSKILCITLQLFQQYWQQLPLNLCLFLHFIFSTIYILSPRKLRKCWHRNKYAEHSQTSSSGCFEVDWHRYEGESSKCTLWKSKRKSFRLE